MGDPSPNPDRGAVARPFRRRARRALTILRWMLIGAAVSSAALTLTGMVFGYQVVAVTSGSMRPAIEVGDALVVHRRGLNSVETGEVIVFRIPGAPTMVAHRVVEVRETGGDPYYRVKGDANLTADATLVPSSQVYGRVTGSLAGAGKPLYWFTQVGLKLSLALLFAIIFAEELAVLIPALRRRLARRAARRAGRGGSASQDAGRR
jgi:signal peptidase I